MSQDLNGYDSSKESDNAAPKMTEISSLGNIFFEPTRTFEYLRTTPKFLVGGLIIIILSVLFQNLLVNKLGEARIKREISQRIEKSPQVESLPTDQKEKIIQQNLTISGYVTKFGIPIIIIIVFSLLALLYWLGTNIMGGSASFLKALSVVVYSSFPPTVVSMIANLIILFLKDADDIDLSAAQRGLVNANPSFLLDGKEMPVLTTLVSVLDVFQIWGWILAAIGLSVVGKISKGSAWAIVILFTLIGITFRIVSAVISGVPS